MFSFLQKLKARLGPLWWYTIVLFGVQRLGDVINVFIGLWLVPHHVPATELGAVMPLVQLGGVLSLPIAILMIPFGKFINVFAVRDEYGKIKALLRDVFLLTGAMGILLLLAAYWLLPGLLSRIRIQAGLLPWLIIASGITTATTPLFSQALQGLKKFRTISLINIATPPVRLLVLALTMPLRGLSGYFSGQLAADGCNILISLTSLRKLLSSSVLSQAYRHEWREMGGFILPVAFSVIARRIQTAAEFFIIRHHLADSESGAYYFLTRFADIPSYLWVALGMVLFPLVSERHEQGQDAKPMLRQALLVIMGGGLALSLGLHLIAPWLFDTLAQCRPYRAFTPLMGIATATSMLRTAIACVITYELACRRYRFVTASAILALLEAALLYLLGHGTALGARCAGWLTSTLASTGTLCLNHIVWLIFAFAALSLALLWLPQPRLRHQMPNIVNQ